MKLRLIDDETGRVRVRMHHFECEVCAGETLDVRAECMGRTLTAAGDERLAETVKRTMLGTGLVREESGAKLGVVARAKKKSDEPAEGQAEE